MRPFYRSRKTRRAGLAQTAALIRGRGLLSSAWGRTIVETENNGKERRLVLSLFASLAEFEHELIRERTLAGLAAARTWGRVGGRKPCLPEKAQRMALAAGLLCKARALSVDDMARSLRILQGQLLQVPAPPRCGPRDGPCQ